jgi:hypothetical protein
MIKGKPAFSKEDLNALPLLTTAGPHTMPNHSGMSTGAQVIWATQDLHSLALKYITASEFVLGCMAWVNDRDILQAMSLKKGVALLLQKERWLHNPREQWQYDKLELYNNIRGIPFEAMPWPLSGVMQGGIGATAGPLAMPPVRMLGDSRDTKGRPLMHNKFLIFCRGPNKPEPYAVWTGSTNLTFTARRSLENAVIVFDKRMAQSYMQYFCQLYARAEELSSTSATPYQDWIIDTP